MDYGYSYHTTADDTATDRQTAQEAQEMRQKARRLIRNADLIRDAIHGRQEVTEP